METTSNDSLGFDLDLIVGPTNDAINNNVAVTGISDNKHMWIYVGLFVLLCVLYYMYRTSNRNASSKANKDDDQLTGYWNSRK